jgi:hypothetical protein
MLLAGDEAAALAVREVRGFEAAAADLADEPATLPGIVIVVVCNHMREAEGNNSRRRIVNKERPSDPAISVMVSSNLINSHLVHRPSPMCGATG